MSTLFTPAEEQENENQFQALSDCLEPLRAFLKGLEDNDCISTHVFVETRKEEFLNTVHVSGMVAFVFTAETGQSKEVVYQTRVTHTDLVNNVSDFIERTVEQLKKYRAVEQVVAILR